MEPGRGLRIGAPDQSLQSGFVGGGQGRCDQLFVGGQCDLIAGNERQLFRHTGIDLVTDRQQSEFLGVAASSCSDRAEKYPIETPIVVPPGSVVALLDRSLQIALGGFLWPAGIGHVQSDDLSVRFGQDEKIAARQFPERCGAVLDRERMLGGHQGFQRRQIRQHGRHARELAFALALNALERADRSLGAVADLTIGFDADGVANDKQESARQRANGHQRGDEELRSQAEMRHGSSMCHHCECAPPLEVPGTNL